MTSVSSYFFVLYWIILALYIALQFWAKKRNSATLMRLAELLELSSEEIRGSSVLEGHYHGRSATLGFVTGTRFTRPRFYMRLGFLSSISYRASRELPFTTLFSRYIETGVAELDSRYYFLSSEPERFTRWVAGSNAVRDAIKVLLEDRGVDLLSQEADGLNATVYGYSAEQTSPEYVRGVLDALIVLAQHSPDHTSHA
jgi:hypothetical protein